ncbi:NfeD family protein, partial [Streptomyces sp. SID5926]|nr:NfeD family protein [Streptomyces sp. SID5926]
MDPWLIWLIVSAVLILAEIFTLTAALGMLGVAALITAASAAAGLSTPFQFLLFTVVSAVTLL